MPEPTLEIDWNNEYNFWHKLVSEEVERLRFNEGYEPIRFDLYPTEIAPISFVGKTSVGHVNFNVTGRFTRDKAFLRVLRVEVLKAK